MRALALFLAVVGFATAIRAADEKKPHESLASLRADYAAKLRELDRSRIRDLAALAKAKPGEEADQAYEELFGLAMAKDLYDVAAPFAAVRAADAEAPLSSRAFATLVQVVAKADEGKHEESFATLAAFLKANAAAVADPNRPRLPESTAITLGEAYLQRLLASRRYDLARKLGTLIAERVDRPAIKAHFEARLARLDLVGKPAPEIVGKDVDGKTVKLADFKGKVVLLDFWAAWCPPCIDAIPELAALREKYGKDGFEVVGVNLDAHREEVGSVDKARPIVRRLVVSTGIAWPNILGDVGAAAPTVPYGVTDIPANFLIGRDGSIVAFELHGAGLDKAIAGEVEKK